MGLSEALGSGRRIFKGKWVLVEVEKLRFCNRRGKFQHLHWGIFINHDHAKKCSNEKSKG